MIRIVLGFLLFTVSAAIFAGALPEDRHLVAYGQGFVEAMPDMVTVGLDVTATRDTSELAKMEVDRISAEVILLARGLGIPDEDINASVMTLYPDTEWDQCSREKYVGQQVGRSVVLTLRNLEKYPELMAGLARANVSSITAVNFWFSNLEDLEKQAMDLAVADARLNAQAMAKSFGVKLGSIYRISLDDPESVGWHEEFIVTARKLAEPNFVIGKKKIEASIYAVYLIK